MVTRRNDARRRRVLSEEFVPTNEDVVAGDKKPMQAYSYGANRRNQPKTTDIIPKRPVAFSLFFACVFTLFALLNVLAFNSSSLVEFVGDAAPISFALSGPGSLANWVCCVCLLLCSGLCVQLFLIRKYKRDDYGGMYHVWILMAIMFLFASVDCAIDLRTIVANLFAYMTHRSLLQPPWLMMTIESIILAIVVIRMLFEVRASRFSLATVLLVWAGFVGCIILRHAEVPIDAAWFDQKTAYGNCVLLGCVGSLVSLTVYARFVFLHAHGLIQLKMTTVTEATGPAEESKALKTKKRAAKIENRPVAEPQSTLKIAEPSSPQPALTTVQPAKAEAQPTQPPSQQTKKTRVKNTRKKKAATATQEAKTPAPAPQKQSAKKPSQSVQVAQKKANVDSATSREDELQQELENIDTVPMSKSERRRQRKLAKRAARQNKAA